MGVISFVVLFWGEGKDLENVLSPVYEIRSSEMYKLIRILVEQTRKFHGKYLSENIECFHFCILNGLNYREGRQCVCL